MATTSLIKLSGSTDGKMIAVAATGSPGTAIHTAHASDQDRVFLRAINTSASPVLLTIEYGGTTTANLIEQWIEPEVGFVDVVLGDSPLTNAMAVAAFAGTASVINIAGFVIRITP